MTQAQAIVRLPGVKARTGLSRSSLYKFVGAGLFPRPVRLGPRAIGWIESELTAWIEARVQSREGEPKRTVRLAPSPVSPETVR